MSSHLHPYYTSRFTFVEVDVELVVAVAGISVVEDVLQSVVEDVHL